jgi:hypothetical protein
MQVFIIGTPLETAMVLSKRHLNNQINEAKIILDALNGAKAWSNHPCVLQYRGHEMWIEHYRDCLMFYARGEYKLAQIESYYADDLHRPSWHTCEYFDQMKRRLYTKDPEHYKQWADLGESQENYYYVDGQWRIYKDGKRVQ